jgi:hypothetical protein
MHGKKSIDQVYEDSLTLEHAPPESLGGKVVALTSDNVNSKSGYTSDLNLREFISHHEFSQGNGEFGVKYYFGEKSSIRGVIRNTGEITFEFRPTKQFEAAEKLKNELFTGKKVDLKVSMKTSKFPKIGFLKTSLLIAFHTLGYSFFFGGSRFVNPNTKAIVDQINNPEEDIISQIHVFSDDFPDDFLGASIIYEPIELRSVLIVFDLVGKVTNRIGVLLPGPDEYGWNELDLAMQNYKDDKKIDLKVYPFRKGLDLTRAEDSTAFLRIWEQYNGVTRK